MEDLFILFSVRCDGDRFYYAIQERTNVYGGYVYELGKVYHGGLISRYERDETFSTKKEAIKAAIKLYGKKLTASQLKRLYSGKSLVSDMYFLKVTTSKFQEVTDTANAREIINTLNELLQVWKTLDGYKEIEVYKIGCNLPKRIYLSE